MVPLRSVLAEDGSSDVAPTLLGGSFRRQPVQRGRARGDRLRRRNREVLPSAGRLSPPGESGVQAQRTPSGAGERGCGG
eukprot:5751572-Alexandrium_andersonii.AAC.1